MKEICLIVKPSCFGVSSSALRRLMETEKRRLKLFLRSRERWGILASSSDLQVFTWKKQRRRVGNRDVGVCLQVTFITNGLLKARYRKWGNLRSQCRVLLASSHLGISILSFEEHGHEFLSWGCFAYRSRCLEQLDERRGMVVFDAIPGALNILLYCTLWGMVL